MTARLWIRNKNARSTTFRSPDVNRSMTGSFDAAETRNLLDIMMRRNTVLQ